MRAPAFAADTPISCSSGISRASATNWRRRGLGTVVPFSHCWTVCQASFFFSPSSSLMRSASCVWLSFSLRRASLIRSLISTAASFPCSDTRGNARLSSNASFTCIRLPAMDCTKPETEAAREAVRVLGGPTKAARLLRVPKERHQTVQSWMKSRVPAEYCPDVEAETRALGAVVHCERLRPDVRWGRIRGFESPSAGEVVEAHGGNVAAAVGAVHHNEAGGL